MLAFVFALIVAAVSAEECSRMCTLQYDPVCGTDRRTYGNMCQLSAEACTLKTPLRKAYDGTCSAVQDACPRACTMQYDPVCGTDGNTYGNKCQLTSQACLAKKSVQVAHSGACAQCQRMCTMQYDPVCGTDGRTYGNTCQLESQACQAKSNTKIAHQGACVECPKICTLQYDPVCGSDGVTYGNECQLTARACAVRNNITVAKRGAC